MKTKRIISLVVAILFFVNNISYALGPAITSGNLAEETRPGTKDAMYALGQKLFAAKVGPGAIDFDNSLGPTTFRGSNLLKEPFIALDLNNYQTKFIKADYRNLPADWKRNNSILEQTDLITALKMFRGSAIISSSQLEIEEGWFPVDEEAGELPIAHIEPLGGGRYVLIIHTKFVQMWNHIRKNDVWFELNLTPKKRRTVSVAWGIFYRLAKHEMAELSKKNGIFKSLGHIAYNLDIPQDDEGLANEIGGNYATLNDAIWMWFLGSYCFANSTRYDNETFLERLNWFFEGEQALIRGFHLEFPNLLKNSSKRLSTVALACAINYNFFYNRPGAEVPKTYYVKPKFIEQYDNRQRTRRSAVIREGFLYATGGSEDKDVTKSQVTKSQVEGEGETKEKAGSEITKEQAYKIIDEFVQIAFKKIAHQRSKYADLKEVAYERNQYEWHSQKTLSLEGRYFDYDNMPIKKLRDSDIKDELGVSFYFALTKLFESGLFAVVRIEIAKSKEDLKQELKGRVDKKFQLRAGSQMITKPAPNTRPGKSPEDLIRLIAFKGGEGEVLSAPKLLELYKKYHKVLGFDPPAKEDASALQTIRRDLYDLKNSLFARSLVTPLFDFSLLSSSTDPRSQWKKGEKGEYLFELTEKGYLKIAVDYLNSLSVVVYDEISREKVTVKFEAVIAAKNDQALEGKGVRFGKDYYIPDTKERIYPVYVSDSLDKIEFLTTVYKSEGIILELRSKIQPKIAEIEKQEGAPVSAAGDTSKSAQTGNLVQKQLGDLSPEKRQQVIAKAKEIIDSGKPLQEIFDGLIINLSPEQEKVIKQAVKSILGKIEEAVNQKEPIVFYPFLLTKEEINSIGNLGRFVDVSVGNLLWQAQNRLTAPKVEEPAVAEKPSAPATSGKKPTATSAVNIDVDEYNALLKPILRDKKDVLNEIRGLYKEGRLSEIFPVIEILKDKVKYTTTVFEHTLRVVEELELIEKGDMKVFNARIEEWRKDWPENWKFSWTFIGEEGKAIFDQYRRIFNDVVKNPEDRELIYLIALLHDVEEQIRTQGHPIESAKLIEPWLRQLGFSEEKINKVKSIIRSHVDLGTLYFAERTPDFLTSNPGSLNLNGLSEAIREKYIKTLSLLTFIDTGEAIVAEKARFYSNVGIEPGYLNKLRDGFYQRRWDLFSSNKDEKLVAEKAKNVTEKLEELENLIGEDEMRRFKNTINSGIQVFDYGIFFFRGLKGDSLVKLFFIIHKLTEGKNINRVNFTAPSGIAPRVAEEIDESILKNWDLKEISKLPPNNLKEELEKMGLKVETKEGQLFIFNREYYSVVTKLIELRRNSGLPFSTVPSEIPIVSSNTSFWSDVLRALHFEQPVYRRVEREAKTEERYTGTASFPNADMDTDIKELRTYDVSKKEFYSIRKGEDVRGFILQPGAEIPPEAYFMHRGIFASREDIQKAFYDNKIRFDITIIPPALWGVDFAKTVGHYHDPMEKPEIYQVVSGEVLWLMQKTDEKGNVIDFITVKAKAGDIAIMLPGYGHVSVNLSQTEPLIMANWLTWHQSSFYGSFKEKKGAAYYVLRMPGGESVLVPNPEYEKTHESLPEPRQMVAKDVMPEFGLKRGVPIYDLVKLKDKEFSQKVRFLYYPEEFTSLLTPEATLDEALEKNKISFTSLVELLFGQFLSSDANVKALAKSSAYRLSPEQLKQLIRQLRDTYNKKRDKSPLEENQDYYGLGLEDPVIAAVAKEALEYLETLKYSLRKDSASSILPTPVASKSTQSAESEISDEDVKVAEIEKAMSIVERVTPETVSNKEELVKIEKELKRINSAILEKILNHFASSKRAIEEGKLLLDETKLALFNTRFKILLDVVYGRPSFERQAPAAGDKEKVNLPMSKEKEIMDMLNGINKDTIKSPERIAKIEAEIKNRLTPDDIDILKKIRTLFENELINYQMAMVTGGYGITHPLDNEEYRRVWEQRARSLLKIIEELQNPSELSTEKSVPAQTAGGETKEKAGGEVFYSKDEAKRWVEENLLPQLKKLKAEDPGVVEKIIKKQSLDIIQRIPKEIDIFWAFPKLFQHRFVGCTGGGSDCWTEIEDKNGHKITITKNQPSFAKATIAMLSRIVRTSLFQTKNKIIEGWEGEEFESALEEFWTIEYYPQIKLERFKTLPPEKQDLIREYFSGPVSATQAAPHTRPGKSPEDLIRLIKYTKSEGKVLSTPMLLKLYKKYHKVLKFIPPAEDRDSALKTIRRDLYDSENSLCARGLVAPYLDLSLPTDSINPINQWKRGKGGEYLFYLTFQSYKEAAKARAQGVAAPAPAAPADRDVTTSVRSEAEPPRRGQVTKSHVEVKGEAKEKAARPMAKADIIKWFEETISSVKTTFGAAITNKEKEEVISTLTDKLDQIKEMFPESIGYKFQNNPEKIIEWVKEGDISGAAGFLKEYRDWSILLLRPLYPASAAGGASEAVLGQQSTVRSETVDRGPLTVDIKSSRPIEGLPRNELEELVNAALKNREGELIKSRSFDSLKTDDGTDELMSVLSIKEDQYDWYYSFDENNRNKKAFLDWLAYLAGPVLRERRDVMPTEKEIDEYAKSVYELLAETKADLDEKEVKNTAVAEESPILSAISEYVIDIGLDIGPGSVEPTANEIASFYPIYEMFSRETVEIYLPSLMYSSLTDEVRREVANLNKRIRGRTGREDDAISFRPYDSYNLDKFLKREKEGVRRIFVNDNSMTDLLNSLLSGDSSIFRGKRLITTSIPQTKDKKELSVYQAWLVKVALLSAMVEESNMLTVGSALKEELKGRLDADSNISEFVTNLAGTENEAVEAVAKRINYFLGKIVKLSQFIGEQIRILKAFWTAA